MPNRTLFLCYLLRTSPHLTGHSLNTEKAHKHTLTVQANVYLPVSTDLPWEESPCCTYKTEKKTNPTYAKKIPIVPKKKKMGGGGRHISVANSQKALKERNATVSRARSQRPGRGAANILLLAGAEWLCGRGAGSRRRSGGLGTGLGSGGLGSGGLRVHTRIAARGSAWPLDRPPSASCGGSGVSPRRGARGAGTGEGRGPRGLAPAPLSAPRRL